MSRKEIVHERPPCTDPARCGKPINSYEDITVKRGLFESIISSKYPRMNEHALGAAAPANTYGSTKDTMNDQLCFAQLSRGGVRENDEPHAASLGSSRSSLFNGK